MTLILTDNAATEIRNLVARPEVPDESGVRIASSGDGTLVLSLAAEPASEDTVVDNSGARVFLEPEADAMLDDLTLDAGVDPEGQVQFSLAARHRDVPL